VVSWVFAAATAGSGGRIRDSVLAVTGGDPRPAAGGWHPVPRPKTWGYTQQCSVRAVYDHDRRSVTMMTQRDQSDPFPVAVRRPYPNSSTRAATPPPCRRNAVLPERPVRSREVRRARLCVLMKLPEGERLDRLCRLCSAESRPAAKGRSGQVRGRVTAMCRSVGRVVAGDVPRATLVSGTRMTPLVRQRRAVFSIASPLPLRNRAAVRHQPPDDRRSTQGRHLAADTSSRASRVRGRSIRPTPRIAHSCGLLIGVNASTPNALGS